MQIKYTSKQLSFQAINERIQHFLLNCPLVNIHRNLSFSVPIQKVPWKDTARHRHK